MNSNRLLIIDGNSIMNRAFYGIMSSKTLMSADGTYTNAIYGFLRKSRKQAKSYIFQMVIGCQRPIYTQQAIQQLIMTIAFPHTQPGRKRCFWGMK